MPTSTGCLLSGVEDFNWKAYIYPREVLSTIDLLGFLYSLPDNIMNHAQTEFIIVKYRFE